MARPNGKKKRPHLFRFVLSHSRKAHSEVVWRQDTETFLRALENALWHFGGVPQTLVVDNLKAAVIKENSFDPDLNPKIQAFAEHYGTVILPTKPRMPRHKGKIERQVGFAQSNALEGREFPGLANKTAIFAPIRETRSARLNLKPTYRRGVSPTVASSKRG